MDVLLNCLGESADPIIIDVASDGYVLNESRFTNRNLWIYS